MYNLRYHIASLVAVFLALSVGLLLGTVVVQSGAVSRQRNALVEGLQKNYADVRTANNDLSAANARLEAFSAEAADTLSGDVLAGKTVVVLADPSRGDIVARTSDTIRQAGGTPVFAAFTDKDLGLGDAATAKKVGSILGVTDSKLLAAKTAEALAAEWTTAGDPRPVTKALQVAGRLTLEGLTATSTIGGAAVTGTLAGKPDPSLLQLAGFIRGPGRFAVGVESIKKPTGVAAAAVKAGLSAVDDIDDPLGRISLVWILSGRASGYFGLGSGADSPYPKPLFPAQ